MAELADVDGLQTLPRNSGGSEGGRKLGSLQIRRRCRSSWRTLCCLLPTDSLRELAKEGGNILCSLQCGEGAEADEERHTAHCRYNRMHKLALQERQLVMVLSRCYETAMWEGMLKKRVATRGLAVKSICISSTNSTREQKLGGQTR